MFNHDKNIVLLDTEFTSWEGARERNWSGKDEHREIIQVGAVLIDTASFEEIDAFCVYIKPVKNYKLSKYIVELTGITQIDIDSKGLGLKTALEKLDSFSSEADFYSWGLDGDVILENCEFVGIECPINKQRFLDIRPIFSERGIDVEKYMSSTIVEAFGKNNPGRAHDALSDARGILLALKELEKNI